MELGSISVKLDKSWELNDFATFTKKYVDLYSFFYTLNSAYENKKPKLIFSSYPWEGGYSVVNFYRKTYGLIQKKHRPQIIKIEYSSPGFIELSGVLSVASEISALIGTICAAAYAINKTYDAILSSYIKRKLARLKLKEMKQKLTKDNIDFIQNSVKQLAENFGLDQNQIQSLAKITNGNELIQLKMLLALYRRAKPIAKQQLQGKTII